MFLVSNTLAASLTAAQLRGFFLDNAEVAPGANYSELGGTDRAAKDYRWLRPTAADDADCWLNKDHQLCVSDRMHEVLTAHVIDQCVIKTLG